MLRSTLVPCDRSGPATATDRANTGDAILQATATVRTNFDLLITIFLPHCGAIEAALTHLLSADRFNIGQLQLALLDNPLIFYRSAYVALVRAFDIGDDDG
jgi:hypothetical protein